MWYIKSVENKPLYYQDVFFHVSYNPQQKDFQKKAGILSKY